MADDLTRREEQRGWRIGFLWAVPLALVIAFVLVLASYWNNIGRHNTGMQESTTYGATEPTKKKALGPATLKTEKIGDYGTVLTDDSGHPLYLFEGDREADGGKAVSTCYEKCAKVWTPLLSDGKPQAAEGAESSMIGTASRRDGADQVTYNGWPLYRYAEDVGPEKATGQDVKDFGAKWYLLNPSGKKVEGQAESGQG